METQEKKDNRTEDSEEKILFFSSCFFKRSKKWVSTIMAPVFLFTSFSPAYAREGNYGDESTGAAALNGAVGGLVCSIGAMTGGWMSTIIIAASDLTSLGMYYGAYSESGKPFTWGDVVNVALPPVGWLINHIFKLNHYELGKIKIPRFIEKKGGGIEVEWKSRHINKREFYSMAVSVWVCAAVGFVAGGLNPGTVASSSASALGSAATAATTAAATQAPSLLARIVGVLLTLFDNIVKLLDKLANSTRGLLRLLLNSVKGIFSLARTSLRLLVKGVNLLIEGLGEVSKFLSRLEEAFTQGVRGTSFWAKAHNVITLLPRLLIVKLILQPIHFLLDLFKGILRFLVDPVGTLKDTVKNVKIFLLKKAAQSAQRPINNPFYYYGQEGDYGKAFAHLYMVDLPVGMLKLYVRKWAKETLKENGMDEAAADALAGVVSENVVGPFFYGTFSNLACQIGHWELSANGTFLSAEEAAIARKTLALSQERVGVLTVKQLAEMEVPYQDLSTGETRQGSLAGVMEQAYQRGIKDIETSSATDPVTGRIVPITRITFNDGTQWEIQNSPINPVLVTQDIIGKIQNYFNMLRQPVNLYKGGLMTNTLGMPISDMDPFAAGFAVWQNGGFGIGAGISAATQWWMLQYGIPWLGRRKIGKKTVSEIFGGDWRSYRTYYGRRRDRIYENTWKMALAKAAGNLAGNAFNNITFINSWLAGTPHENPWQTWPKSGDVRDYFGNLTTDFFRQVGTAASEIYWASYCYKHNIKLPAAQALIHLAGSTVASGIADAIWRQDSGIGQQVMFEDIRTHKLFAQIEDIKKKEKVSIDDYKRDGSLLVPVDSERKLPVLRQVLVNRITNPSDFYFDHRFSQTKFDTFIRCLVEDFNNQLGQISVESLPWPGAYRSPPSGLNAYQAHWQTIAKFQQIADSTARGMTPNQILVSRVVSNMHAAAAQNFGDSIGYGMGNFWLAPENRSYAYFIPTAERIAHERRQKEEEYDQLMAASDLASQYHDKPQGFRDDLEKAKKALKDLTAADEANSAAIDAVKEKVARLENLMEAGPPSPEDINRDLGRAKQELGNLGANRAANSAEMDSLEGEVDRLTDVANLVLRQAAVDGVKVSGLNKEQTYALIRERLPGLPQALAPEISQLGTEIVVASYAECFLNLPLLWAIPVASQAMQLAATASVGYSEHGSAVDLKDMVRGGIVDARVSRTIHTSASANKDVALPALERFAATLKGKQRRLAERILERGVFEGVESTYYPSIAGIPQEQKTYGNARIANALFEYIMPVTTQGMQIIEDSKRLKEDMAALLAIEGNQWLGKDTEEARKTIMALRHGLNIFSPVSTLLKRTTVNLFGEPLFTYHYGQEYNPQTGKWQSIRLDTITQHYRHPFGYGGSVTRNYEEIKIPVEWPTQTVMRDKQVEETVPTTYKRVDDRTKPIYQRIVQPKKPEAEKKPEELTPPFPTIDALLPKLYPVQDATHTHATADLPKGARLYCEGWYTMEEEPEQSLPPSLPPEPKPELVVVGYEQKQVVDVPEHTVTKTIQVPTAETTPLALGPNITHDVNLYVTGKGYSPWTHAEYRIVANDINSGPMLDTRMHYNISTSGVQSEAGRVLEQLAVEPQAKVETYLTDELVNKFKSELDRNQLEALRQQYNAEKEKAGTEREFASFGDWLHGHGGDEIFTKVLENCNFAKLAEQALQPLNQTDNLSRLQDVTFHTYRDIGREHLSLPTLTLKAGYSGENALNFDDIYTYTYNANWIRRYIQGAAQQAAANQNVDFYDFLNKVDLYHLNKNTALVGTQMVPESLEAFFTYHTRVYLPDASRSLFKYGIIPRDNIGSEPLLPMIEALPLIRAVQPAVTPASQPSPQQPAVTPVPQPQSQQPTGASGLGIPRVSNSIIDDRPVDLEPMPPEPKKQETPETNTVPILNLEIE
jgi:hypothetical protein